MITTQPQSWDSLQSFAAQVAASTSTGLSGAITYKTQHGVERKVAVERSSRGLFRTKTWTEYETRWVTEIKTTEAIGPHWPLGIQRNLMTLTNNEHIHEELLETFYFSLMPNGALLRTYIKSGEILSKKGLLPKTYHEHESQEMTYNDARSFDHAVRYIEHDGGYRERRGDAVHPLGVGLRARLQEIMTGTDTAGKAWRVSLL